MTAADSHPCDFCGATPAIKTFFVGLTGMVLLRKLQTTRGYFCRDCGDAAARKANSITARRGWWSISGWAGAPVYLMANSIRAGKVRKLPEPVRPGRTG